MYSFEKEYFNRTQVLNANVYETCGSLEKVGFKSSYTGFIKEIEKRGYEGLTIEYEEIPDNDHNNVYKPSLYKCMRYFYA